MKTSLKAVVFDYGGVLSLYQSAEDAARLALMAGIPDDAFADTYWGYRDAYDRGDLDGVAYWRAIAEAAGRIFSSAQIKRLIDTDNLSWGVERGVMVRYLEQLAATGMTTALISNMSADFRDFARDQFDWLTLFKAVTLSCNVGRVKPDAAIYLHCLAALGVAPADALFVDDRLDNVEGARRVGMRAVRFETPAALAATLDEHYDLPPLDVSPQ